MTDVELQRELLIHRFGFQPADILALTDQQATRETIVQSLINHLLEQAKPDDVVVFHFSGHGSSIQTASAGQPAQPSLVTIDDAIQAGNELIVSDVLEATLLWLLRSLPTANVTTVLDASTFYPGRSLQGSLRIRSRPTLLTAKPRATVAELREQILSQIQSDALRQKLAKLETSAAPGVLLKATGPNHLATEARWNGFSAGLFTYALTQQLWQATSETPLQVSFDRATARITQLATSEQQPQLHRSANRGASPLPYHLLATPATGADGVVLSAEEGGSARVWLGGLPLAVLEHGASSLLNVVNAEQTTGYLQVSALEGLSAKAKVWQKEGAGSTIAPGQFVREQVRLIPRNLALVVGLDSSLERIERVDAVSALSNVARVTVAIAGEQPADYLFSRQAMAPTQVASTNLSDLVAATPAQSSYGLFSLGQEAIPQTAGDRGEAVKVAVRRLVPKLQTLLAAKMLNLTVNDRASHLPIRIRLEAVEPHQSLICQATSAMAPSAGSPSLQPMTAQATVAIGSRIQYRLENGSSEPLYFLLFNLDSNGNLLSLSTFAASSGEPLTNQPSGSDVSKQPAQPIVGQIAAAEVLTIPSLPATAPWIVRGPIGMAATYILCSRSPFSQTKAALEAGRSLSETALYPLTNPLEVMQAVLQDLHQASGAAIQPLGLPPDSFALDMSAWASFRFVYQIM